MKIRSALGWLLLVTSLVYGTGVGVPWARSHARADVVTIHLGVLTPPVHVEISSGNGILHADFNYRPPYVGSAEVHYGSPRIEDTVLVDRLEALGTGSANDRFVTPFCWRVGQYATGQRWAFVNFPHWFAIVPASGVWLFFLLRRVLRRARHRREGLCTSCGYDLTGNVSGRCPECGKAVS